MFKVSASASVPNLSSPQEFSSVMDEFLTSNVSRAPALLDVNSVVEDISSKNELPKNAPDTVGLFPFLLYVSSYQLLHKTGASLSCSMVIL